MLFRPVKFKRGTQLLGLPEGNYASGAGTVHSAVYATSSLYGSVSKAIANRRACHPAGPVTLPAEAAHPECRDISCTRLILRASSFSLKEGHLKIAAGEI